MDFPYYRIIRQAFGFVRTHKFLWGLGLFLIWSNLSFYSGFSSRPRTEDQQMPPFADPTSAAVWVNASDARQLWFLLGLFLIIAIILWLYVRSKAGLIVAIKALVDKKPTGYIRAFKSGKLFSGRIFGLWLLSSFSALLLLLILSIPIAYLIFLNFVDRAFLLALIALMLFIPLALIIGFVYTYSVLFVVLHDMTIKQAARSALDLVARFWAITLTSAGGAILATVIGSFLALFAIVLASLPFVILAAISYYIGGPNLLIPAAIAGLTLGLISFVVVQSATVSFIHVCWTLVFMELVKPKKIQEAAEPEIVPEVISGG
jgi:hypothetical protein